jgi:hypothetical protein
MHNSREVCTISKSFALAALSAQNPMIRLIHSKGSKILKLLSSHQGSEACREVAHMYRA